MCRCDGGFTVTDATSGPFQQPARELSADHSLNTPRNRLVTPASHLPAVPEPPGSSRARVINAPCGGKSWRWPCQSRFAFLACLAPLTLQLLARRKPCAGKKKEKKAEPSQKFALRGACLGPVASENCAKRCWSPSACAVRKHSCPQRGHGGVRSVSVSLTPKGRPWVLWLWGVGFFSSFPPRNKYFS